MTWQDTVKTKQAERSSKIPKEWLIPTAQLPPSSTLDVTRLIESWLAPEEVIITQSSATIIVQRASTGEWKAVDIVRAFAHRACLAQQLINPLTEIAIDTALEEAQKLDEYYAAHGQPVGPLHGLPISLKDSVNIRGLPTSFGFCAYADKVVETDAVITAAIRRQGGIPYVKTNVGHTLMMGETVNHLWGRTLNPYNRNLTPGGSSGGESALVGIKGSPLGIGTDIGGSIRLPAASTGLYGLRPCPGRVSYRGFADTFLGQEAVRSTAGPLASHPEDLDLFMRSYLATAPWEADPDVLPISWRSDEEVMPKGQLCFAYAVGDEQVTPHPPIARGLQHAIDRLSRAGHKVVQWQGSLHAEASSRLIRDFWTADGGEDVRRNLEASGEPLIHEVADLLRMPPVHDYKPPDVFQTWQDQNERNELQRTFHDQWIESAQWSGTGRPIDGLIMPCAPFTARPHGAHLSESRFGMFEHTYANLQPILQLTSGAFPSGLRQDPEIDIVDKGFVPRSELDQKVYELYTDPHEWTGAPIGCQLICRRLEEEKLVKLMCIIRDAIEGR